MSQRIIYQNDSGGVNIIIPTAEAVATYGIKAIASKDVPSGKPYKIVSANDIPKDRSARDAWILNPIDLTDGVGGEKNEFD